ncbi:hypothetical protein ACD578_27800 (plasmid) [Microvirga sp. RSM25]|uniref:hypothetical protein n=1 Tax=Microvirga sp. RSM25 TaxID=3273802 RepID=UPI00384FFA40
MSKDYSANEELSKQLGDLLADDVFEHPAARATARLVAEHDLSILTPDQRFIYDWHIRPYLRGAHSDEDPECMSI